MLRIKKNPKKKPAEDVTFGAPSKLKQNGVEMLIALNLTPGTCVTGPEVGIDAKILVTKEPPHLFYNPNISESKDLHSETKDRTICISYRTYQDDEGLVTILDEDGSIRKAITNLHNGIARANKKV